MNNKPKKNHPWRNYNPGWLKRSAAPAPGVDAKLKGQSNKNRFV